MIHSYKVPPAELLFDTGKWCLAVLETGRTVHLIFTGEEVQGHLLFSLQWNEDIVNYSPFSVFTKARFCNLMRRHAFSLAQSKEKWAQTATFMIWNLKTSCTDPEWILFIFFPPTAWICLTPSFTPNPLTHVTGALYLIMHRETICIHFP